MKRAALILAAAALGLALAVPAFSGATGIVAEHPQSASEGPAVKESAPSGTGAGPVARLSVAPNPVLVDGRVLLDASRSSDKGAQLTKFTWDLNGDGAFESDSGTSPRIHHVFTSPGNVRVGVRVLDNRGASAQRFVALSVPSATTMSEAAGPRLVAATEQPPRSSSRPTQSPPAFLHSASTFTVTMSEYKFTPRSLTVHVGDTITWVNHGAVGHTATANNGAFNTKIVGKGKSRAFKFTRAGTYPYYCIPHRTFPMTATIKVVGTGSGGSGGGSGGSGNNKSPSGGSSPSNSSSSPGSRKPLPHTGLAIASLVLIGLGLLGAGVLLRGGTAPHRPRL